MSKDIPFGQHPPTHELVKLLLARMDTHPEEFSDKPLAGPFSDPKIKAMRERRAFLRNLIEHNKRYFTPAEKHKVNLKLREINLTDAYASLSEELLK